MVRPSWKTKRGLAWLIYEDDLVDWFRHEMMLKEPDADQGDPGLIEYPEIFEAADIYRVGISTIETNPHGVKHIHPWWA
jgi:hypothetical protein